MPLEGEIFTVRAGNNACEHSNSNDVGIRSQIWGIFIPGLIMKNIQILFKCDIC